MKTSELAGAALDWAVAKAEGKEDCWGRSAFKPHSMYEGPPYSTSWALGGPIIERERIDMMHIRRYSSWTARIDRRSEELEPIAMRGPTALIAAMRAFVASKLGDEVDIPKELL